MTPAEILNTSKCAVVKIGSSLLVAQESGRLRATWLASLAHDVAALKKDKCQVLVVSSGAIALGRQRFDLPQATLRLEDSQAAAAVGQIALAHAITEAFAQHNLHVGQILITPRDTEDRRCHLNARATLSNLLSRGIVPIINENDTVATQEIRFGDNDRLAARVAVMISADCLLLLSDIDGLYDRDPHHTPEARHIPQVEALDAQIVALAEESHSPTAHGGMVTKLAAARIAQPAGCSVIISDGRGDHPLARVRAGARATCFPAQAQTPKDARKKWIAASLTPRGRLVIDQGAVQALSLGASLLPVGVRAITGDFLRGDAVYVSAPDGQNIAVGLVAHDHAQAIKILGRRTAEIAAILGYNGREEMIHRDNLSLYPKAAQGIGTKRDEKPGKEGP